MEIEGILREDNQVIAYLNESIRMIYYNEQNEKKIFWWWLNKFEYIASITEVPDNKMAELFMEMVHVNIQKRVQRKFPAVDFTELSYKDIVSHYVCYFNYSDEILSHRKPFQDRNHYEREAIIKYANILLNMSNSDFYRCRLERKIVKQYCNKFNDMELTKYFKEIPDLSLRRKAGIKFAKDIELACYINPAFSMIKIYNSKNTGNFHDWLHKFEYVASITNVPDDTILEFFNNMVDNDDHSAVELAYPEIKVSELSYEKIINLYLEHFGPSHDLHKTRLLCRIQYKHETIETYANSLRKLSIKCSHISELNKILREHFLNGIRDDEIRIVLNKFPRLSFDEMIEFATELAKFKTISTYLKPAVSTLRTYNDITEGEFYEWLNKFEYVADIIEVPSNKIHDFFKNMVHSDIHALVRDPYPRIKFSYELIVNRYLRCLYEKNELTSHRERFIYRRQYEHETLQHFANSLWRIQHYCQYKDNFEERLREKFRHGIYDENIKAYIDKYPDLSFDGIVAIAIAHSNEISLMEDE